MTTSTSVYQTDGALRSSTPDESQFGDHLFLADPLPDLEDNAKVTSGLIAALERDPHPQFTDAVRTFQDHRRQVFAEVERRYARIERHKTEPLMVEDLRDQALALIVELPVSQYLASIRPGILLRRDGNTFHGPCPYIGHDFDEGSFRIYGDDFAWCERCGGGNLFRVIGLVEALPSPYEQVNRAAEIAGLELPNLPRNWTPHHSLPTPLRGDLGRKDRAGRGQAFQPIRIVNGRVSP